jgi:hypothetical protein
MKRKKDITKPEQCQNCNHPIGQEMEFCPNCGQKALPEHLTLKYFIHEFLNNYFSFDSKFFKTIRPLVSKPAFLTQEFIDGRRIRYINPIQLFVFISFLYFLVDSFMILKEVSDKKDFVVMKSNGETISSDSLDVVLSEEASKAALNDSLNNSSAVGDFIKKSQEFNQLEKDEQNEKVSKIISYFIFLLMPLFALFLNWLYSKSNRRYLENLIFSLHFHAFFFLSGTFFMLVDRLVPDPFDSYSFGVIVLVYLLTALKIFYNYSWTSTIFRLIGLFFLYGFMVFLSYLLSIVISILL